MIPVFSKLKELIATVTEIRWTDLDKGQIDKYQTRPSIAFPAALLRISINRVVDLGSGIQRCYCTGNVRLVFDFDAETNNHVPDEALASSLEYFNTTEKVYKAIHYKGSGEVGKFMRKAQAQEMRNDGLVVMNIPFETTFIDKTAAVD